MALPTYHCLECDKDFKAFEWDCKATGQNHLVTAKRYYMADAPTVPEIRDGALFVDKSKARTQVMNIPPERKMQEAGETVRVPGGDVWFIRGMFETNNPEQQFYLDRKEGLCSYERWKEVYWTDAEKANELRYGLEADRHRLESERNELLAQVKAMQEKPERKKPGPKPKMLEGQPA